MKKYLVRIYEAPHEYEVEAEDKAEAELKIMAMYNGGQYDNIYKIKITQTK